MITRHTEAEVQAAIDEEWPDPDTRVGGWYCHECTRALIYDVVETRGGDCAWGRQADGRECTEGEEDEEIARRTETPY